MNSDNQIVGELLFEQGDFFDEVIDFIIIIIFGDEDGGDEDDKKADRCTDDIAMYLN